MSDFTLISVSETAISGVYDAQIEVDLGEGTETIPFTADPNDPHGLAPAVNAAIQGWIAAGSPVAPFAAPEPTSADVTAERNRRIAAGFSFGGKTYDFDDRAKANISGAGQLAFMAIVAGAQTGDLRWHGGDTDFAWIAADNSLVTMDAQTVVAFGQAAAEHERAHIFAARALKDMDPIPDGFETSNIWP